MVYVKSYSSKREVRANSPLRMGLHEILMKPECHQTLSSWVGSWYGNKTLSTWVGHWYRNKTLSSWVGHWYGNKTLSSWVGSWYGNKTLSSWVGYWYGNKTTLHKTHNYANLVQKVTRHWLQQRRMQRVCLSLELSWPPPPSCPLAQDCLDSVDSSHQSR